MQEITFFYVVVSVSAVFLVVVMSVLAYHIIITLKMVREFLDNSNDIVKDVRTAKNSLEIGLLSNVVKVLHLFSQRR